eukprot:TRINITY_DN15769_c0_g1_i1.p1 TRINITY_DN15769_c0_g1~~TRINITY_DN15769_c0_g1_i1.p1  ORF type:complete len:339 (-),score=95.41 TRINITY_DN15769_c0_g1_i1:162-1178(-)
MCVGIGGWQETAIVVVLGPWILLDEGRKGAKKVLKKGAMRTHMSRSPEAHFQRALIYLARGDPTEKVLHSLNKCLAKSSDFTAALYVRGNLLAAEGRYEEAITDLSYLARNSFGNRRVMYTFPKVHGKNFPMDQFEVRINRGRSYFELGRLDEARADFEAAMKLSPDHWIVFFNLSHVARAQGNVAEALELAGTAVACARKDADTPWPVLADILSWRAQLWESEGEAEKQQMDEAAAAHCRAKDESVPRKEVSHEFDELFAGQEKEAEALKLILAPDADACLSSSTMETHEMASTAEADDATEDTEDESWLLAETIPIDEYVSEESDEEEEVVRGDSE